MAVCPPDPGSSEAGRGGAPELGHHPHELGYSVWCFTLETSVNRPLDTWSLYCLNTLSDKAALFQICSQLLSCVLF